MMQPLERGGWTRKGWGCFLTVRHQGLMLNKMLCVVPPTVISCVGLTREMLLQTQANSATLEMDFEEFGGTLEIPRSWTQGACYRVHPPNPPQHLILAS